MNCYHNLHAEVTQATWAKGAPKPVGLYWSLGPIAIVSVDWLAWYKQQCDRRSLAFDHAKFVRVDRSTPWGNPWAMKVEEDRLSVIQKYSTTLLNDREYVAAARLELAGKHLVCHCAPNRCHAINLARAANSDCSC